MTNYEKEFSKAYFPARNQKGTEATHGIRLQDIYRFEYDQTTRCDKSLTP